MVTLLRVHAFLTVGFTTVSCTSCITRMWLLMHRNRHFSSFQGVFADSLQISPSNVTGLNGALLTLSCHTNSVPADIQWTSGRHIRTVYLLHCDDLFGGRCYHWVLSFGLRERGRVPLRCGERHGAGALQEPSRAGGCTRWVHSVWTPIFLLLSCSLWLTHIPSN